MPLIFVFFGVMLLIATLNDNQDQLFQWWGQDITSGGFLAAVGFIVILYFLSFSSALKTPAKLFAGLTILALFLASGSGIWSQLTQAIANPTAIPAGSPPAITANPTININSPSGGGGIFGNIIPIVGAVAAPITGGASLAAAGVAQDFSGGVQP